MGAGFSRVLVVHHCECLGMWVVDVERQGQRNEGSLLNILVIVWDSG